MIYDVYIVVSYFLRYEPVNKWIYIYINMIFCGVLETALNRLELFLTIVLEIALNRSEPFSTASKCPEPSKNLETALNRSGLFGIFRVTWVRSGAKPL